MKKNITVELMETMFSVFHRMKDGMSLSPHLSKLSILQMRALFYLKHHDNTTMSMIADYFHIELPSATSLMNKLYDHQLVNRYEVQEDRRLVRIALTEKGKELLQQTMDDRRKKMEKMLSYLSTKEKQDFLNIMKTIQAGLQTK